LIELLANARPLLLALDDLHWADPSSIDLVCRLLHRGLASPSLLLLASRPGQSETRLSIAFEEAKRHGQARHIELGPLSATASRELLGTDVDPALVESLYRESGGNPFYLEQLAAARARGKKLAERQATALRSRVPAAVSGAIGSEIDGISTTAKALLRAAAVLGDPFEADLAAEVAGNDWQDALGDLDELLDRDLIRPGDWPSRFRFRHPIVRDAVYESLGAAWRIAAHARVSSLLDARGAPVIARAPHVERSARVGDADAAAILTDAGQAVLLRAPASAARWFEISLRLTPEGEEHRERRLILLAQHAMALGRVGNIKESRDELLRYLELASPEPNKLRVQAAVLGAAYDGLIGDQAAGRRLLLEELAKLSDQGGEDAGALKRGLAETCYWDADWQETARWAKGALAADCQDMQRVGTLALLTLAEFGLGHIGAAQHSVSEAAQLFDRIRNEEEGAYFGPGTAIYLTLAETEAERFADAFRHGERGLAFARASGQYEATAVHLLAIETRALAAIGRVAEVASVADAAIGAGLLTGSEQSLSAAMSARAWASLLVGDLADSVRLARRAAGLAPTTATADVARIMLAGALLETGEAERCREQLTDPDGELAPTSVRSVELIGYELLVRGEIALGNRTRADELAEFACRAAERLKLGLPVAMARRAHALVCLERGEVREAAADALASCQAAEQAGARIEAGRSRVLVGKTLAAAGDRAGAIAALKAAHGTLIDCGAFHYSNHAARELRKLGCAVPPPSHLWNGKRGILGLTDREGEVIELVAAGKTNREIAGDLFLSTRTVDRHLARIFEKLNVHSRAAATSAFERAGDHS
jgi:DNA-binding CsgD family transcriptional regulator